MIRGDGRGAVPDLPGFEPDTAINGRLAFYVGPVLVAEVKMGTFLSSDGGGVALESSATSESADPYQAIFVSYAHRDTRLVENLIDQVRR